MTEAEFVREIAQPLAGGAGDHDALLTLIGDARPPSRLRILLEFKLRS
jgi:hypothetical protein